MRKILPARIYIAFALMLGMASCNDSAEDRIKSMIKRTQSWAADPVIIEAVKAHNQKLTDEEASMTQENWRGLTVTDSIIRGYMNNPAALFLKANKDPLITEAFVSGADGKKVAFLNKPTHWSHLGMPKHDEPMQGRNWQGKLEMDDSTGHQQIQIAVPVMDGGKPIGSIVVGISAIKLSE